jgi:hypothetical protein
MAANDYPGPGPAESIDGLQGRDDPEIVGDPAVLKGDIQIGSDQYSASVDVEVVEGQIAFGGHPATLVLMAYGHLADSEVRAFANLGQCAHVAVLKLGNNDPSVASFGFR